MEPLLKHINFKISKKGRKKKQFVMCREEPTGRSPFKAKKSHCAAPKCWAYLEAL